MASVAELQKQLKRITEERDQLRQDVEKLCLNDAGNMFSGAGYVMSEQLLSLQKEVKQLRTQLQDAKDAHEEASQELSTAKAASQALEHALSTARQQAREAATERDFYQASAQRASADVEAGAQELDVLRGKVAELEVQLGESETRYSNESRVRKELETTLAQRMQQLTQLRSDLDTRKAEQASTSRQLALAREAAQKLDGQLSNTQTKYTHAKEELDRTHTLLQQLRESEGRLRIQSQEAETRAAGLQGTLKGQEEQIARLTSELSALRDTSHREIESLTQAHAEVKRELNAATDQVSELSAELRQAKHDLSTAEQRLTDYRRQEHDTRAGITRSPSATAHTLTQHTPHTPPSSSKTAANGHVGTAETAPNDANPTVDDNTHDNKSTPVKDSGVDVSAATEGHSSTEGVGEGVGVGAGEQGSAPAGSIAAAAARDLADDAEQLVILRTMVHDLKMKLALATQEKVQALLTMAELKQQMASQQASFTHTPSHTHHQSLPGTAGPGSHTSGKSPGGSGLLSTSGLLSVSPTTSGFAAFMAARIPGLTHWMPGAAGPAPATVHGEEAGAHHRSAAGSSVGSVEKQPLLDMAHMGPVHDNAWDGSGAGGTGNTHTNSTTPRPPIPSGAKGPANTAAHTGTSGGTHTRVKGPRGDGGDSSDLPSPVQSYGNLANAGTGIHSGTHAGTEGGSDYESDMQALRQLVADAGVYLASLEQAAKVILGEGQDPSLKWNALTGLSKLHAQLNQSRARLGLAKPAFLQSFSAPRPPSLSVTGHPGGGQETPLQLTEAVLNLVDLSLACLEAYQRQEALSSVMAIS